MHDSMLTIMPVFLGIPLLLNSKHDDRPIWRLILSFFRYRIRRGARASFLVPEDLKSRPWARLERQFLASRNNLRKLAVMPEKVRNKTRCEKGQYLRVVRGVSKHRSGQGTQTPICDLKPLVHLNLEMGSERMLEPVVPRLVVLERANRDVRVKDRKEEETEVRLEPAEVGLAAMEDLQHSRVCQESPEAENRPLLVTVAAAAILGLGIGQSKPLSER